MTLQEKPPSLARFGAFTADLRSGELWKEGVRIRLQIQPFQILSIFLERPNELITREELQRKIWPSDTFVDFDQGLNKAINKLRDALHDTADNPRFIETIPRRGYRFIAPVVLDPEPIPPEENQPEKTASLVTKPAESFAWRKAISVLAIIVTLSLISFLFLSKRSALETNDSASIAVLPMVAQEKLSGDYDLAEGMTDGIINDLSLVPNLRVISHTSVFQYRGLNPDPQTIGQKLNVAAVLTGRLTWVGPSMILNLELTATSDGRHLWGQQYARNVSDRAALQQEVAGAVADALRLSLSPSRRQQISRLTTSDAEAEQLYFKGRYYFFKETPEDVLRARALFQQAIDRDPTFALAYGALGDSYDWMATEGFQPADEVVRQSRAAKSKANELNDSLAEIHSSIGALEFVQWNWATAEIEFQKALQLNPNYFEGHHLYSIYLRSMRRFPEAIQHARLADTINPLSMPSKSHLALTYYYARQYEVAAEQYRLIIKDDPNTPSAHAGLSAALLKLGKEKEAIQEWQKALSLAGDEAAALKLGKTFSRDGLRAAQALVLRAELETLNRTARKDYVSPVEFAFRYALLNDKEDAFRWLESAYVERSPQLFNLNVDPDFDNLRDDPRYSDLVSRLHLPQ